MSILDFVLKTPFNHLGRTEAGNAILLVSEADYDLLRSLASRTADQPAAAHERWKTCPCPACAFRREDAGLSDKPSAAAPLNSFLA
jgi:hypothetical protein